IIDQYRAEFDFAEIIPTSALQGQNIEELLKTVKSYLPEGPQFYPEDQISDHPEYFIISELIREKVLHLTKEEVHHSIAVVTDKVERGGNGNVDVYGSVIIGRRS